MTKGRIFDRWMATLIVAMCVAANATSQQAVGSWRDCVDLTAIYHVAVVGDEVYAAGRGGVARYDTEYGTMSMLSRSTGLSDAGICAMEYDPKSGSLVIAYSNANVDVVQKGRVYNVSDIKRTDRMANKEIHSIRCSDSVAYLCTDFGVVCIDLKRREIKKTWYLGADGGNMPVYDVAFYGDSIYAATSMGLMRVSRDETHPEIGIRWESDGRTDGMTATRLTCFAGELLASGYTFDPEQDTLYRIRAYGREPIVGGELLSVRCSSGRLLACVDGHVKIYDTTYTLIADHTDYTWGRLEANDATYDSRGTLWVAHPWDGIVGIHSDGSDETHRPESPASADNVYRLVPRSGGMMLCPGGHTTTFENAYVLANLFTAHGKQWSRLDLSGSRVDGQYDLVDAAVNPRDTNETVVALWGMGLASVRDGRVQEVYDDTSTGGVLERFVVGNYGSLRTSAVGFDKKGNLWVAVSNSNHGLAVRHTDGTWESFATNTMEQLVQVDKMVVDSVRGYIWLAGRSNMIYVMDGDGRMARVNPNNGSKLETETVNAIVQDHNGNIWIGTNKGIKVIYDGYNAFKNGGNGEVSPVTCSNITISNGSFAEYLMAYEKVTAIAVDGANRKWVGTGAGGLYLISSNGLDQLQHFTTTNSPLLSDKVQAIGVQPDNGDVYVGTDRGLQVYRSTATYAEAWPRQEVYAYPNPVRPDYDGPVAIKGFTRNALVHITDAAGHTVFSTRANGGQAMWNTRTASGERVASGVYYVFASDADGGNKSVAKILVVR